MTLYISDLDGTLMASSGKLKPRTIDMLNRFVKKGVLFSYATARSIATASVIMHEVELEIPVITMNGVMLCDPKTKKRIVTNYISREMCENAMEFLTGIEEFPLVYKNKGDDEKVCYLKSKEKCVRYYLNMRKGDKRLCACDTIEEVYSGDVFYITVINPKKDNLIKMNEFFSEVNGFDGNYQQDSYDTDDYWYEIFAKGASKAAAALKLKEITGADELVCFGDNKNDIPMLLAAERGYAVENAFEEVKAAACGIIHSNDNCGVTEFIERDITPVWAYNARESIYNIPDSEKYEKALSLASAREISTIGTMNEKTIHSSLKHYYASEDDHEKKIGSFQADAVNENGIFEIQTGNFNKLVNKLDAMLDFSHVTVVYPYEKRVSNQYVNMKTGEFVKKLPPRTNSSLTDFFFELYRIKGYLTNPNLSICIAEMEIIKILYVCDEKCARFHGQKKEKYPTRFLREVYLQKADDFRIFLPQVLPEKFTKAEFSKCVKNCDGSIMLEIYEYLNIVRRCGKKGNSFIYALLPPQERNG